MTTTQTTTYGTFNLDFLNVLESELKYMPEVLQTNEIFYIVTSSSTDYFYVNSTKRSLQDEFKYLKQCYRNYIKMLAYHPIAIIMKYGDAKIAQLPFISKIKHLDNPNCVNNNYDDELDNYNNFKKAEELQNVYHCSCGCKLAKANQQIIDCHFASSKHARYMDRRYWIDSEITIDDIKKLLRIM